MSLSERFDKLPAPQYQQMPVKPNSIVPKRINNNNNTIYDEAIIASSEPQIIRPNVTNLIVNYKKQNKMKATKPMNAINRNRNGKALQNRVNKPIPYMMKTNRGRGFKNNNNYNNARITNPRVIYKNGQQSRAQPRAQPQPKQQASGYRSYRTSTYPLQQPQYSPYKRPIQTQPKVRQLPKYPNYVNNGYNRDKNHPSNNRYGHNNNNRQQKQYQAVKAVNNNNNNNNYFQNKRQQYHQQNHQQNRNNFNRNNLNRNRTKNNYTNSNVNNSNKNNKNNNNNNNFNGNNNRFNGKFKFNKKAQPNAAALDRELDAYLMKNPDVEARTNTINSNLDKELDDYWKNSAQNDERNTSQSTKTE